MTARSFLQSPSRVTIFPSTETWDVPSQCYIWRVCHIKIFRPKSSCDRCMEPPAWIRVLHFKNGIAQTFDQETAIHFLARDLTSSSPSQALARSVVIVTKSKSDIEPVLDEWKKRWVSTWLLTRKSLQPSKKNCRARPAGTAYSRCRNSQIVL